MMPEDLTKDLIEERMRPLKAEEFAGSLSFWRGKAQKTQVALADDLKVTDRTIKLWESGASVPRIGMRMKIAQEFGLDVTYFLWENDVTERITQPENKSAEQQMQKLSSDMTDFLMNPDISSDLKKSLVGSVWDVLQKSYSYEK